MPSAFSHLVVAGSLGVALRPNQGSWRFWVLGAACSILPDLDVITRCFLPFRPIEVSPIRIGGFMTGRGMESLASEVIWVWLPASLSARGCALKRRWLSRGPHVSDL